MWALVKREPDARERLSILRELSAQRQSYFPVRFVFMSLGLALASMVMPTPMTMALACIYVALDILLVLHGRRLEPYGADPARAYQWFILHRCLLVCAYDGLAVTIALHGTFISQATAMMLICGQALHMLANRTALVSLMLPDLIGISAAVPFVIYSAQGWGSPEEVIIFGAGMLTLLAFCIVVSFRAVALHERLRSAAQGLELAQRAGMIGHLTGGIAHDFNNLLTVMRGNLDLLHEVAPEERPALLAEIEAAASRGSELVARLSETGRPGTGQPESTQVSQCAQRAACMARRTLPANVRIELYLDASAVVRAAPLDLEMVLLNLLMNAADAMPRGGHVRLRVVPEAEARKVTISVEDEGVGMSREMVARATEPYQTSKPPGQGTGLGLAMVKGFVDQAGGTLDIQSALQQGTTITLCLPLVRPPAQQRKAS